MVKDGKISDIIIRPLSASGGSSRDTVDLSSLKYLDYGTANITFAVNAKNSSASGNASRSGTKVIISASIEELNLNIGDGATITPDGGNNGDFITLSNGKLTINTKAASGSVCKFTAVAENATHTVTFTMKPNNQIEIEYIKVDSQ